MSFKIGDLVQVLPNRDSMEMAGKVGTVMSELILYSGIGFGNKLVRVIGHQIAIDGETFVAAPHVLRLILPPDDSRQVTNWNADPLLRQIRQARLSPDKRFVPNPKKSEIDLREQYKYYNGAD